MSEAGETNAWVIAADAQPGIGSQLREFWKYRRVLAFFSVKSLQSLYAKTHLGVPWLFIRVLFPLFVGSFVFGGVMRIDTGGTPYFIFFATGMIAWNFFDGPLVRGSRGIEVNRELMRKLYIPRMILPLGQMAAGLVEPLIIGLVLVGSAVYYRVNDGVWHVQFGPSLFRSALAALLVLTFAFALSLCTSIWQARARDVRFALRYVISFWMYFTPVIYPLSRIPPDVRWLAYLNPLTAPVEMFKSGVLAGIGHSWPWLGYSAAVTVAVLIGGVWHFARTESATMDKL